ncbi:MAG: HAMP domain-containing histidine kinase, partial [Myxococcales bacterium]|nr:HAMP domain-containing histidine kinase [Myxococcales bacterium]
MRQLSSFEHLLVSVIAVVVCGLAGFGVTGAGLWFLALMMLSLGLTRTLGERVGSTVLVVTGAGSLFVLIVTGGGANSHFVVGIPIGIFALWIWVGRTAALVAAPAVVAAQAVVMALGYDRWDPNTTMAAHVITVLIAAVLVRHVVADMRMAVALSVDRAEASERAAQRAREADQARDRFLDIVSRELRTPLDSILGYTGLSLEEECEPDRIADLRKIETAGRQLLALVDDLLDLSRVQANDLDVMLEPVEVEPLVHDVVAMVRPLLDGRRNSLEVDIEPGILVQADLLRARQVLLNLAVNAGKFTEGGRISLRVRAQADQVAIEVSDNGVGIREDRLADIFLPFVQLRKEA